MTDPRSRPVHLELPRSDHIRPPARFLMHLLRPPVRALVRRRFGVRLTGAEHVPARGAVILAANHLGAVDGPLLVSCSPRPVHALTKQEMFAGRGGVLLRAAGQVRLDRFHPDPAAIKACVGVLRDGHVVGVFPEGTRGSGDLERFQHGAAYLALVTGAPVVPVIILGTRTPGQDKHALPARGGPVDLVFGPPWQVPAIPWPRRKAQVNAAADALQAHLRVVLDDALSRTGQRLPGPLPPHHPRPEQGAS